MQVQLSCAVEINPIAKCQVAGHERLVTVGLFLLLLLLTI
jgi:hypothetical protein